MSCLNMTKQNPVKQHNQNGNKLNPKIREAYAQRDSKYKESN